MIKNKKLRTALWIIEILLIIFQALTIGLRTLKDYYLIYDWIFYGINYVVAILLFLLYSKNRYLKWLQLALVLILVAANTTFFYYVGNINLVISKSQDNKHELILKEYNKMSYETMKLRRRWLIFGKKTAVLTGSSKYKTIEKGTYKIQWISGDTAVLIYRADDKDALKESIFSFRSTNYVSYINVAPALTGKWYEKDNHNNYFMYDKGKIVYAKDGQLYYYDAGGTEQQGISSIIITGDDAKPSIIVVLNSDCNIDNSGLINTGGTITILTVSLEKTEGEVYYRE